MRIYVVIPAYNEEEFLARTLQSLVEQTLLPEKIIVVNDSSSDGTQSIIDSFSVKHDFIRSILISSEGAHAPGSKIVKAFKKGLEILDQDYDVICKFDADLIFPKNYLETISEAFKKTSNAGLVGGFCYIKKNGNWILENLTNQDHIRGALKAYSKECFEDIGGLKNTMGWDTVDELLAKYHGWEIVTDSSLHVKHLKPTGYSYTEASKHKQGEAFFKMRYGFWLTAIASAKLALKKQRLSFFRDCMKGYFNSKKTSKQFIVSEEEGKFIRVLRWKGIAKKLF